MFYNKSKAYKFFLVFVALFFSALFFINLSTTVLAGDTGDVLGTNIVENEIALGNSDPRNMVTKIINIALGLLGIVAVIIVIYGGFIWMTAGGEEEKIEKAKKILKAGIIGLVIILSAWGIVTFVLNKLGDATGNGSGGSCNSGETQDCGCYGTKYCLSSGTWGNCIGSDYRLCGYGSPCSSNTETCVQDNTKCNSDLICGNSCTCVNEGEGDSCGTVSGSTCSPNNDDCDNDNLTCDATSCTCEVDDNNNEFGDSCGDIEDGICSPDNNDCNLSHGLTCDATSCTCVGAPIITKISPIGGFCDNNVNTSCSSDNDCSGGTCNLSTPNATAGNLITILGYNFGDHYSPTSSQVNFIKGDTVISGQSPTELNDSCVTFWSNNQIIIALPTSTSSGI